MSTQEATIVSFLKKVMHCRKRLPNHLASDLGVSPATVSRWLSCKAIPDTNSCKRLAEYTGVPLGEVLFIVGYLPRIAGTVSVDLPEFREYARQKYPDELDEELITMIENLIERRRKEGYGEKDS